MIKRFKYIFPKKGNKHINIYSTSLVTREKQIKSIMRYYFIPIMMTEKKKDQQFQIFARMWNIWITNTSLIGVIQPYWKQFGSSL